MIVYFLLEFLSEMMKGIFFNEKMGRILSLNVILMKHLTEKWRGQ